jgi:hypothetical protein
MPNLNSASDYWKSIMAGGPAAQAATAPYAEKINAQAGAEQKQLQNNLPAGGEKNLALAQLPIQTGANIAGLYAGLGPQAASALGGLGGTAASAGTGSGGVSANAAGSNLSLAANQAAAKNQMFGGIGSGLGTLAGGYLGGPAFSAAKGAGGK